MKQHGTGKEVMRLILESNLTTKEISAACNCTPSTGSYFKRKLGKTKKPPVFDWCAIQAYYDAGHTYRECAAKFGFNAATWGRAVRAKKMVPRHHQAKPLESCKSRSSVRRRIMKDGLLPNACAICKRGPTWCGKPLSLHLDHINGIPNDHRIENLRLICPNCHSQTETYCGRNVKVVGRARLEQASCVPKTQVLPLN